MKLTVPGPQMKLSVGILQSFIHFRQLLFSSEYCTFWSIHRNSGSFDPAFMKNPVQKIIARPIIVDVCFGIYFTYFIIRKYPLCKDLFPCLLSVIRKPSARTMTQNTAQALEVITINH